MPKQKSKERAKVAIAQQESALATRQENIDQLTSLIIYLTAKIKDASEASNHHKLEIIDNAAYQIKEVGRKLSTSYKKGDETVDNLKNEATILVEQIKRMKNSDELVALKKNLSQAYQEPSNAAVAPLLSPTPNENKINVEQLQFAESKIRAINKVIKQLVSDVEEEKRPLNPTVEKNANVVLKNLNTIIKQYRDLLINPANNDDASRKIAGVNFVYACKKEITSAKSGLQADDLSLWELFTNALKELANVVISGTNSLTGSQYGLFYQSRVAISTRFDILAEEFNQQVNNNAL